jgi:ElaB/YqjD/DUF883 family membrane-anchored ribosome-binding protein
MRPAISSKSRARNNGHATIEGVRQDLGAVRADLGRLKTDAVGVVTAGAESVISHVRDNIDTAMEKGRESAEKGAEQVSDFITRKPFTSVLIAMGVGAIVGRYLFKR